jgi:CRISPR-associated protein Csb1
VAARCIIASLGLVAMAEQGVQGYALRSRCDLVCQGASPLEKASSDGSIEQIELTQDDATELYAEALVQAGRWASSLRIGRSVLFRNQNSSISSKKA